MTSVLWVDDNKRAGRGTAKRLERSNPDVSVTAVYSAAEAREHLERIEVDVVVSGHELPDGDSKEVFRHAVEQGAETTCVLYSENQPSISSVEFIYVDRSGDDAYNELERTVLNATLTPDVGLGDLDFGWSRLQDALDRLAEIAAVTLEAKAAFLTQNVEGEEVIVASYGIDPANISGSDAVCRPDPGDEVVAVTDVPSDPRFKGSFYTHFGIQSVMTASIHASSDVVLCVVDDRRRDFNPEETYLLRTIAAEAEDQLRLRRKYVEARNRERPPRVDTN